MKNTLLIGLAVAAVSFSSCKKDSPSPSSNTGDVNIRYEFTSDVSAPYRFTYTKDTDLEETVLTQNWSKALTVSRRSTPRLAKIVVHRPDSWAGTTMAANVTLKIFIDNVQKKDTAYLLTDADRTTGISVTAAY
jgi:hypothetical protein